MASEAKIDHIEYGGVSYEFEDSTARKNVAEATLKIYSNNDALNAAILAEKNRAMAKEQALENSKVSITEGKVLSSNDFTDEDKELLENPATFIGATDVLNGEKGVVPKPMIADKEKYLKGDGTWDVPTNTTYSVATHSTDGLLSKNDKYKLDTMDTVNDELQTSSTTFNGNTIRELVNGKIKTTTFNSDGTITQIIQKSGVDTITLTTEFTTDEDGNVVVNRTRS